MFEVKVVIETQELVQALNNLAEAISGGACSFSTKIPEQPRVSEEPYMADSFVQESEAAPEPYAPQAYIVTIEQIIQAGSKLIDDGKMQELVDILSNVGVKSVIDLKPDQIEPVALALRNLGADL